MIQGKRGAWYVFLPLLMLVVFISYQILHHTESYIHPKEDHIAILHSQYSQTLIGGNNQASKLSNKEIWSSSNLPPCHDPIWCTMVPPTRSLFRFADHSYSPLAWRMAQIAAATGEPVLLRKILPHFPNYLDFLDGDTLFRSYHMNIDHFVGKEQDMGFLAANITKDLPIVESQTNSLQASSQPILPSYYAQRMGRAPVLRAGFHIFARNGDALMFQGTKIGEGIYMRRRFIKDFFAVESIIKTPFILLSSFNENWGLLSGHFPNRTADWQPFPSDNEYVALNKIFNHPKTLLILVNQHSNMTHPKLVTLPRGLPLKWDNFSRRLWDLMRKLSKSPTSKETFVFTASSNWGYRPKLKACLSRKLNASGDFEIVGYDADLKGRVEESQYFNKLGKARISIALAGLGYDSYRLWESLTLGTMPVVERGVGLDKTLWRLPALLVDDYDQVTPDLLQTAYVEALYRAEAGQFEFERLKQSFWWSFISNVSRTMSTEAVFAKFPPEADDPTFARPMVPFTCPLKGCGLGTKRTPKSYC